MARPATVDPKAAEFFDTKIRALLAADMVDDAMKELRYAQLVWGDSAAIQATLAYANQQLARRETGMRQLQLVRAGMNGMRRA